MAIPLRVSLDVQASPAEVEEVARILHEAGIDADVAAEWEKPAGVGNGAFWMVLVALGLPVGAFLKSFGSKLGEEAGKAAWEALRDFVARLRTAREPSVVAQTGWVELADEDGTTVMIGDEPDAAFLQLLGLDWEKHRGWMLLWDDEAQEWYDPNRRY